MLAIVKYNAGNAQSVLNALTRLGVDAIVTDEAERLSSADGVIIPGVGSAAPAIRSLREKRLDEVIVSLQQPILGICLGMQLFCDFSEEGQTKCLGVFNAVTMRMRDVPKLPHMGWNNIEQLSGPLFKGIPEASRMYFVHSYAVPITEFSSAKCRYGMEFSAAIERGNFFGVQFHPEKSGVIGEKLIENFIGLI